MEMSATKTGLILRESHVVALGLLSVSENKKFIITILLMGRSVCMYSITPVLSPSAASRGGSLLFTTTYHILVMIFGLLLKEKPTKQNKT